MGREVRKTVNAFYQAFNSHDFTGAAEFTTDDWAHITRGGWTSAGTACWPSFEK